MIFEAYGNIEINEYAQSLYFLDSRIRVYYILGGIIMDALREERNDMEKERRRKGTEALDRFFSELNKNPMAFMKDGSVGITEVLEHSRQMEKARCMRKITVMRARLEALYSEMQDLGLNMLEEKTYASIGEDIMHHLNEAITGYYELIDYYTEELAVLGFRVMDLEVEANGYQ